MMVKEALVSVTIVSYEDHPLRIRISASELVTLNCDIDIFSSFWRPESASSQ